MMGANEPALGSFNGEDADVAAALGSAIFPPAREQPSPQPSQSPDPPPTPLALKAFLNELDSVALALRQPAGEGEHGMGTGESRLLQLLGEHNNLTVPQLARLRGTSRQNVQILVNRLIAEGCVELNGNPAHKRSALVYLTEQGRTRLRLAREHEHQLEAELLSSFSEAQLSLGLQLLGRLREVLSPKERSPGNGAARKPLPERPRRTPSRPVPQRSNKPPAGPPDSAPGLTDQPTDFGLPANLL